MANHDELAHLSDAEREALLSTDGDEGDEQDVLDPSLPGATDPMSAVIPDEREKLTEVPEGDEDETPADPPADTPPADAPPVDTPPADDVPPAEPIQPDTPPAAQKETVDFQAQFDALAQEKQAIAEKAENGDISFSEMMAEMSRVNQQETALQVQQAIAQREEAAAKEAEERRTAEQKSQWDKDCASFIAANAEYKSSELRFNALNSTVIKLAERPENWSLTGPELLAKAHNLVVSELGGKPISNNTPPAQQKKVGEPLPDLPTLNKVAAAEQTGASENRFAYLDSLKGAAYEAAYAQLSDAQRAEYEAQS